MSIMGKGKEVSQELAFGESIIKKKSATGVEKNQLYFGFWLPYRLRFEDGSEKIDSRMTILKGGEFGESVSSHFVVKDPESWQFYSKGGANRMSEVAMHQFIKGEVADVDALSIFDDLRDLYKKYISFSEDGNYDYMALFDMCSYFVPMFDVAPQIHVQGFKMCGKTKLMTLSALLSFNGTLMTSFTLATVFRFVDESCPTVYIDEADKLLGSRKEGIEDVVAMFNSGYKRGARIPRCDKNNEVQWYDVFGQKVYGSINNIPNDFASRCHKIIMQRAEQESKSAERAINEEDAVFFSLRSQLYLMALQYAPDIKEMYSSLVNRTRLKHRDWEIWKPILVVAKWVSEDLFARMVDFAEDSTKARKAEEEGSQDWETMLLKSMAVIVRESRFYKIQDLRAIIRDMIEEGDAPYSKWIVGALRKYGFKEFRLVGGYTQVLLSPKRVVEVAERHGVILDDGYLAVRSIVSCSTSSTISCGVPQETQVSLVEEGGQGGHEEIRSVSGKG